MTREMRGLGGRDGAEDPAVVVMVLLLLTMITALKIFNSSNVTICVLEKSGHGKHIRCLPHDFLTEGGHISLHVYVFNIYNCGGSVESRT
jgi:hypothetical protein